MGCRYRQAKTLVPKQQQRASEGARKSVALRMTRLMFCAVIESARQEYLTEGWGASEDAIDWSAKDWGLGGNHAQQGVRQDDQQDSQHR
jgi:hypothetical protein